MRKHPSVYLEENKDNDIKDNMDIKFRMDSKGSLNIPLPGYNRWQLTTKPGSKIIAQGSEDEAGKGSTDTGSLKTGSLSANTVISVGDSNIRLDGINKYISIGENPKKQGPSLILSDDSIIGFDGSNLVFGFFINSQTVNSYQFDRGDFIVGDYGSNKYLQWDASEGKLSVAGSEVTNMTITSIALGSEPSIQGWTSDITFSSSDYNTVAWTSGSIVLTDGTTYSISSGNTGNMTAINYIYFDKATSETVLQKSTTATDSVGAGKILVCVAEDNDDNTSDATFQVFGGKGGTLLTTENFAADTITTNELAANSVTANEVNIGTLSAISANCGTLTSGTITGTTIQTASSGNRVVLDSNEYIRFYNGSGTEVGRMYAATDSGSNLYITGNAGNHIILDTAHVSYGIFMKINALDIGIWGASGLQIDGRLAIEDTGGAGYIAMTLQSSDAPQPSNDVVNMYFDGSDNLKFRKDNGDTAYINLTAGSISTWA